MIDKSHIKRRIMNDEFSTFDELKEAIKNISKQRFVGEELTGDTVHLKRPIITLSLRVHVLVQLPFGQLSINNLDAADFQNSMSELNLKSRGLCIQYYLTHLYLKLSV